MEATYRNCRSWLHLNSNTKSNWSLSNTKNMEPKGIINVSFDIVLNWQKLNSTQLRLNRRLFAVTIWIIFLLPVQSRTTCSWRSEVTKSVFTIFPTLPKNHPCFLFLCNFNTPNLLYQRICWSDVKLCELHCISSCGGKNFYGS